MSFNNHIPNSDLKLAQEVRKLLEEDRSVQSLDDPLMDQIIDYKRDQYSAFENELSESREHSWNEISLVIQKDWNKISDRTSDESDSRIISLSRATFLKVAAAILVAVLLSVFFYTQSNFNQPEIVAQSGQDQVTYTLDDNSQVQLRPHSSLSVVERSEEVVRYQLKGEAFFSVTKDQNRRFLVDAGPGIIEVTGTSFNIREWSGETIVYLQEGALFLNSSDQSKRVLLKPGEVATVGSNSNISNPVQTSGNEFTSWQKNEIILNDRTLSSVINELEYHYSIDITVQEQLKNEILGGTLSLESRTVSLKNLGIVLGGRFSSIGDDKYQFVE